MNTEEEARFAAIGRAVVLAIASPGAEDLVLKHASVADALDYIASIHERLQEMTGYRDRALGTCKYLVKRLDTADAEVAALRGELPEGWEPDPPAGWVEMGEGDEGDYVLSAAMAATGYAWEAWTVDPATRRSGTAPTLLGAIAACEAARRQA